MIDLPRSYDQVRLLCFWVKLIFGSHSRSITLPNKLFFMSDNGIKTQLISKKKGEQDMNSDE